MFRKVFELFRAGTHKAMRGEVRTYTPQEVRLIAQAFDPRARRAPLCPGHPDDDLPELGQVESLHTSEDGQRLFAQAVVSPTLVQAVRDGSITSVSAAFLRPGAAGNPSPFAYYLKHVGFLWAHIAPSLKNLQPLDFADASEPLTFASESITGWSDDVCEFASVDGFPVDPAGLILHKTALHHRRVCPEISYIEAVRRASKVSIM